jgi:Reverse transcriptase (RNA-dependent DNA polymerase)/Endonuclease-reverse transcriptase
MDHSLTIVQYNCGNSNGKATRALFDSFEAPAVIAIQEPGWNKMTKSTTCPRRYQLAYEARPETRVCFMIRRDIGEAHWRRTQYGPNVATLTLRLHKETLSIVNVYTPNTSGPRIRHWPEVAQALQEAQGETILLGDFNTHHSKWGGRGVACDQRADHLLAATKAQGLNLITAKGKPTWKRRTQETTIDLTFATLGIGNRLEFCSPVKEWALTEDHIPIRITIATRAPRTHAGSRRFALQKLDRQALVNEVRTSAWERAPNPLGALQESIEQALQAHCPRSRPSLWARPDWSPRAAELLAGVRRARRRYTTAHIEEDRQEAKHLSNQLKKEMRRNARNHWRRVVQDVSEAARQGGKKGLWKLSQWSRKVAGKPHEDSHLPALREHPDDKGTSDDAERTRLLAKKFFPGPPQADLSDIAGEAQPTRTLNVAEEVSLEEIRGLIHSLPNNKTPGPDEIPNEVLKILGPTIEQDLARAISKAFAEGSLPARFNESTTVALRKEGKGDYTLTGSYRPIALENTLAKLVEKALANRITSAAEEHTLLPWNQMGARKDRSTLSAIGLVTTCVETAWAAKPGSVVSMLSLDLAGAFDNVSHERLLAILRKKGFPTWLVRMVACFLRARRTRIVYAGHRSEWIETRTGIPQGSPLSPILFLFYISELLESLQEPRTATIGLGFVDDTNLITWGTSAEENCQRLTEAHKVCEKWARRHGARFAPEKYQLIHFTRNRRTAREDLASSIQLAGHHISSEEKVRLLGVWLDPKLTWGEHIAHATRKGIAASEALARLATSTWGPSVRNTRLLYTATVRAAITYASQEWSMRIARAKLSPLEKVQTSCLRRITGGYKRTPVAALEREVRLPPLPLYVEATTSQRALRASDQPVEKDIRRVADEIWRRMRTARYAPRPGTRRERAQAEAKVEKRTIGQRLEDAWKARWEARLRRQRDIRLPAVWATPWKQDSRKLYAGLSKAEATALLLMRTEVIGLNAWLASIQVPGIEALCPCGEAVQTVRHVVLHCRRHDRTLLTQRCGTERLDEILSRPTSAAYAARWLIASGALGQFRVAKEIKEEDISRFTAFEDCNQWKEE